MQPDTAFESAAPDRTSDDPLLVVDVAGFEGPLDLLLDLARRQKVDLHEISILALAEQYIAFVEAARTVRLELAADYLVMAAWLAFLKSRLLLPEPPKPEGPGASDLATALAFRLRRLEAIRIAAGRLGERERLGRDVFPRGEAEAPTDVRRPVFQASLHDLLAAYAAERRRHVVTHVTVPRREVWSLAEARAALERLIGEAAIDWVALESYLLRYLPDPARRRSALASTLVAALEMAREGRIALRQEAAYGPLMLRLAGPRLRLVSP